MNKKGRRSFGYIRKLPSKLHQASYVGPDGARYYAPRPFIAKADAEGFLAHELYQALVFVKGEMDNAVLI